MGWQLDLMILEIFSNLNDSMTLEDKYWGAALMDVVEDL